MHNMQSCVSDELKCIRWHVVARKDNLQVWCRLHTRMHAVACMPCTCMSIA